jgi:hypothetical protein
LGEVRGVVKEVEVEVVVVQGSVEDVEDMEAGIQSEMRWKTGKLWKM